MREFNPNHPVTRAAHDHWHKIVAILMAKLNLQTVDITAEDVDRLTTLHLGEMTCVVIREHDEKLTLSLVSESEGRRLSASEEVN